VNRADQSTSAAAPPVGLPGWECNRIVSQAANEKKAPHDSGRI